MNLSTNQKQTHRHREQICGCQRAGGCDAPGVWGWQMQINAFIIDKQQDPNGQHRELYPMSCGNRKEYGKEYKNSYIYVSLDHFSVQQRLAQHCRSTIPQLKE